MTVEAALKYSGLALLTGALGYIAQIAPGIVENGSASNWDHPTTIIVTALVGAGVAGLVKALPWLEITLKDAPVQPAPPVAPQAPPQAPPSA